jgi:hypothetical protein
VINDVTGSNRGQVTCCWARVMQQSYCGEAGGDLTVARAGCTHLRSCRREPPLRRMTIKSQTRAGVTPSDVVRASTVCTTSLFVRSKTAQSLAFDPSWTESWVVAGDRVPVAQTSPRNVPAGFPALKEVRGRRPLASRPREISLDKVAP